MAQPLLDRKVTFLLPFSFVCKELGGDTGLPPAWLRGTPGFGGPATLGRPVPRADVRGAVTRSPAPMLFWLVKRLDTQRHRHKLAQTPSRWRWDGTQRLLEYTPLSVPFPGHTLPCPACLGANFLFYFCACFQNSCQGTPLAHTRCGLSGSGLCEDGRPGVCLRPRDPRRKGPCRPLWAWHGARQGWGERLSGLEGAEMA